MKIPFPYRNITLFLFAVWLLFLGTYWMWHYCTVGAEYSNQARLSNCQGPHDFHFHEHDGKVDIDHYVCTKCGGTCDRDGHYFYAVGMQHGAEVHAKRDAELVKKAYDRQHANLIRTLTEY